MDNTQTCLNRNYIRRTVKTYYNALGLHLIVGLPLIDSKYSKHYHTIPVYNNNTLVNYKICIF